MRSSRVPVVFVHGFWLHTDSWTPWLDRFAQAGYDPYNPGWPGDGPTVEQSRADPGRAGGYGLEDVVDSYVTFLAGLPSPPVVVGHCYGGLVTQRLLTDGHARAAVAIAPAPMRGTILLPPSALAVAAAALADPAGFGGTVALTSEEFRYGAGNQLTEQECATLFEQWTVPSPGRPLFEDARAAFFPHHRAGALPCRPERGPLLLVAAGMDHTAPASFTRTSAAIHRTCPTAVTDLVELDDRGHSLTIDHGWPEVADAVLTWIDEKGI